MESLSSKLSVATLTDEAEVDEFKASLLGAKKKSKAKKAPRSEPPTVVEESVSADQGQHTSTSANLLQEQRKLAREERDAKYASLLGRIFSILREQNPELSGDRKKYSIAPPSIHREGNKKTLFANIVEICRRMNRPQEHVTLFLCSELGTTGSTDAKSQLIIKGRFQQKQIENVLKHYIVEYVTCRTCKSPHTTLKRENRLHFQQCESCGSTRSVSTIKTGFKAQTEKRASQRNREA